AASPRLKATLTTPAPARRNICPNWPKKGPWGPCKNMKFRPATDARICPIISVTRPAPAVRGLCPPISAKLRRTEGACYRSLVICARAGIDRENENEEPFMFTGIVTDIGEVLELEQRGDLRARIATRYDVEGI